MLDTVSGLLSHEVAIDLGSSNTLIFLRGRGVVCREPTMVACSEDGAGRREVVAGGREALAMLGRSPADVQLIRPVRDGLISDFQAAEELLRYLLRRVQGRRPLLGPRAVVCIPYGTTEVEKRAVRECAEAAGARQVSLLEQPIAAALGAELPVSEPEGNMVVDIGGGTTEVAVISLGGVVRASTVQAGGDAMERAIVRQVERVHGLLVGPVTAAAIKRELGAALPGLRRGSMAVAGRDLERSFPRRVDLDADQVCQALQEQVEAIVKAIVSTLERTPPELASDIVDKGILLTGGGSLLAGTDEAIRQRTGLPVVFAQPPQYTLVLGPARALEQPELCGELLHG